MIEAQIQLDRRHARRRVDRDRECRLAREHTIVDHADHHAVDQRKRDRRTIGQGQRRIGAAQSELVA